MALPFLCSLAQQRRQPFPQYPLVVLTANLTAAERATLVHMGADRVIDLTFWRSWRYAPPFDSMEAHSPNRSDCRFVGSTAWVVHGRTDFSQTLVKLALWNLTEYDELAFFDVDSVIVQPPHRLFDELETARQPSCRRGGRAKDGAAEPSPLCETLDFVGMRGGDRRRCRLAGWQTGLFVTRPSRSTFRSLLRRSREGDFSRFTHTEQDVIDAEFVAPQPCEWLGNETTLLRAALRQPDVATPVCRRSSFLSTASTVVSLHHKAKDARSTDRLRQWFCAPSSMANLSATRGVVNDVMGISQAAERMAWNAEARADARRRRPKEHA